MGVQFNNLIIYQDDDIYIINKPAGISSLAERTCATISLFDIMKETNHQARLCHRLDKFTSGAMIISKNDMAYRHISMGFERRQIKKTYHAVVHNASGFVNEIVDVPLVKKLNNTGIVARGGKEALTVLNTLESYGHFSLVECKPTTGRFHQIRIHLQYKGHPIVADIIYGGHLPYLSEVMKRYKSSTQRKENPMITRFALHARRLEFNAPNGQEISVSSAYPKDFETLVKLIKRNDSV